MASQVKDAAWLKWIAGLVGAGSRQTQTAMLPSDRFHCLLDELPLHLIPQQSFDRGLHELEVESLFLNPRCSILPAGQVPVDLEGQQFLLDGFALQNPIAWVRDAASGSLHPFWLGTRVKNLVSGLLPGEPVPDSVPLDERRLLASAGIFTSHIQNEKRVREWAEVVQKGTRKFQERNYAPLRNLIHPFHVAALRRYYRQAIRRDVIRLGDEQSPRRYIAHNEPVARFFHYQIAKIVSAIVGEPVRPSYVYFASYLSGAELKKHTDRAQCEFSVTMCLDFSPEPELATSWPIRLDTPDGTVVIYQALGDGLVYRGTKVPHYRRPLADGHTSTSIFFHYVPESFTGSLE
jgi:hypothetical protein